MAVTYPIFIKVVLDNPPHFRYAFPFRPSGASRQEVWMRETPSVHEQSPYKNHPFHMLHIKKQETENPGEYSPGIAKYSTCLNPAQFPKTVKTTVTDDDMVQEINAQGFASLFHPLGKSVVVAAGLVVVRGVVMA